MDEHRIEKESREVFFRLSDRSEIQGEVFLRLYEAHHSGPQRVRDLLNEERAFIPVKTARGTLLLNKAQIVSGNISEEWEGDTLTTIGKKQSIQIRIAGEGEINGNIFIDLPEGFNRVKDYFNQPICFFPVFLPGRILYVNQRFILSVHD